MVPAFSPQISATEMRYGVVKGADADDVAATALGTSVLGWSRDRLDARYVNKTGDTIADTDTTNQDPGSLHH